MTTFFEPGLDRKGHGSYRVLRGINDRLVRRFLRSLNEPEDTARARLQRILSLAKGTRFAQDHDLSRVRSLEDFRSAVPIRTYDEMTGYFSAISAGERRVLSRESVQMLLETSGTTGRPKLLPVTKTWAKVVKEAQLVWVLSMLSDHPGISQGKALTVVSSANSGRSPGGLNIGSNTGRMHLAPPHWVRARYPVPYEAFCLQPSELRQYVILRFALQEPITSWTTANPSTILLMCRRLQEWKSELAQDLIEGGLRHGPASSLSASQRDWLEKGLRKGRVPSDWRPASIWPLQVINCWKGGPAQYFHSLLPDALGAALPIREVGITASEGYFAVPLGDDWSGGVLWNLGHWMEFQLSSGEVLSSWELEEGMRARLIITTESGLYRYDLADEVEVVGRCRRTPVIRFVGKAGRYLNSTGEKVTEEQVSTAMRTACAGFSHKPAGMTCRIRWGEVPCFELAVEGSGEPRKLAQRFDDALSVLNLEYQEKRSSGRIGPVAIWSVSAGTYQRYREMRVALGAPEGQVKDPVVAISDEEWRRIVLAESEQ